MKEALIIGGGVGGLFTGAILAHEGMKVIIIEKNATIGGGLQSFNRFGVSFDTGMHVIGGMQPDGNIRKICRYLGIMDQVRVMEVDDDCTDSLYFAEDRRTYRIAKGSEGFVQSLASYFPDQRENLVRYEKAIHALTKELPLFNLQPSFKTAPHHSEDFLMAADAFIAKYITDVKLQSVLAYMNPLYGGRKDETPAFVHAIISELYIKGACRFVGGSAHFAQLLGEIIMRSGGKIITGDAVERIEVNNRMVEWVRTKSGKLFSADHYISAIHPCSMLRLTSDSAFPRSYRNRLNAIPNAYSAFALYIKLKKDSFPYINHSEYYMTRYADIWNFGRSDHDWPMGFLCMTPPEEHQGKYGSTVLVIAPMPFEAVKQWEHTTVGHRGTDYEQWKAENTRKLLERMEELHPGFGTCIEAVNASSPLTIRDFYDSKEGTLCGFSKDYANPALSQLPVVTKVRNFLLTGQNNNLHGFCGVALTAIQTAEVILGRNTVLHHIASVCKQPHS